MSGTTLQTNQGTGSNTISIPTYPSNNRVPGVFAVVDASKANTATINQRTLLLGQMLSAGAATAGTVVPVAGVGDAQTAFGAGSQLAIAVERYRNLDFFGELWALPMADAGGAAASTATITITGPATATGVVPLYVDGVRIPVSVNSADTATVIAGNMVTAINNYATPGGNPLSVTAANTAGVVTLTARNKGSIGNQSTINLSFMGTSAGEGQPGTTNVAGVAATITAFINGTTDPVVATALANVPVKAFDFIYCPYNDATSLNAVQAFLGDTAGRWNWSIELFGHCFTAKNGTFSTRTTFGTSRNNQHESAIGANGSPSPDWHWAIDFCAASAVSLRADPAIPVGGLAGGVALNVVAPPLASRDSFTNRNTLLFDGMTTYIVDQAGVVHVDRAITTYQSNAAGTPDNSYLSLNVPFQLMAYIRAWRTMIQSNFNQVKLVPDGNRIPPGSRMVTSQTILAATTAQYRAMATNGIPGVPAGIVTNPSQFEATAQAQNAGGGLVKMLLPVILANQLINVVGDVQFISA